MEVCLKVYYTLKLPKTLKSQQIIKEWIRNIFVLKESNNTFQMLIAFLSYVQNIMPRKVENINWRTRHVHVYVWKVSRIIINNLNHWSYKAWKAYPCNPSIRWCMPRIEARISIQTQHSRIGGYFPVPGWTGLKLSFTHFYN